MAAVLGVPFRAWPFRAASAAGGAACLVGVSGRRGHKRSSIPFGSALWAHCANLSRGALPAALLRPRSRSRSPLPKGCPQSFSWLHSAQPAWATGLSVNSCPAAPPDCSVSSHRCSGSLASVACLVEPRSAASAARVPALSEPRAAAAGPGASAVGRLVEVAPLAPLRHGVAHGISTAGETDVTPNVRCGVRFSVKISPALQCEPAAPTPHLMMISTTPATPLLLFADAFTAPALLSHLSDLSSWWSCRAGSPWTFSPLHSNTSLFPNPTFWFTIPGTTSCSESRPRTGS